MNNLVSTDMKRSQSVASVLAWSAFATSGGAVAMPGCSNSSDDCSTSLTCPNASGGMADAGSSGSSGDAGEGNAGTSGTSGGKGGAGSSGSSSGGGGSQSQYGPPPSQPSAGA